MLVVQDDGDRSNRHVISSTIFPDGTSQVWKLPDWIISPGLHVTLTWHFEQERELVDLMSFAALKGAALIELVLPYLPYARQDKPVDNSSTFNLHVFVGFLRGLRFKNIVVYSPHSTEALEGLEVREVAFDGIDPDVSTVVVFPDESALKRYGANPELASRRRFVFKKKRDAATGTITDLAPSTRENEDDDHFPVSSKYAIVDDLCDGGRTFSRAASFIRQKCADREEAVGVTLHVHNAVFSAGLPLPFVDRGAHG
jgi:ribose-phosphate pyrophosphokinase